jgi:hypothetical protein
VLYKTGINMEERRKQSFIASDMEFENKDIKLLEAKIENSFLKLEAKMLSKADIQEIIEGNIANHKTDCELCKGNYLTVDNCYNEWLKCKKRHDNESIAALNKWWELGRKAVAVGLLLASGGGLVKLAEVFK